MKGNEVSLRGNIVKDCDVRSTGGERNAVSWSIAWNGRKKDEYGEWKDEPHYFDCKCWCTDAQLRIVEPLLQKGNACAIVGGHLVQERWEKDGQSRSRVVVQVDDPISGMLVSPKQQPSGRTYGSSSVYDEDIPF